MTLEGAKGGGVTDLAFSDDGRFLVTAHLFGSVRLWDGHSGRPLASVADLRELGRRSRVHRWRATDRARRRRGRCHSWWPSSTATVCGDLDSLVELAETRVTRELTATEKATYLSGD